MKINKLQLVVLIAACFITVLLRVRDTPIRLDSMIALTLLCGALVRHPAAILLPLGIRLLTDTMLWYQTGYGFYSSIGFDYAAYLMIALLARCCWKAPSAGMVAGGILGPCLFFVISNFGVWVLWPDTYSPTLAGLMKCYALGLPFLGSSLAGNLPFAVLFLAAWHAASVFVPDGTVTVVRNIDPRRNDV